MPDLREFGENVSWESIGRDLGQFLRSLWCLEGDRAGFLQNDLRRGPTAKSQTHGREMRFFERENQDGRKTT